MGSNNYRTDDSKKRHLGLSTISAAGLLCFSHVTRVCDPDETIFRALLKYGWESQIIIAEHCSKT